MITTVGELRELLEEFEDEAPLLLAYQPNYPLAYQLAGVTEEEPQCECDALLEVEPITDSADRLRIVQGLEHHPRCPVEREESETPRTVWLLQGDHTDRPYDVPENLWERVS